MSIFASQSADFSNLETFQTFRLKFAPKSNHNFVSNKPYHADKIKINLNHDFAKYCFDGFSTDCGGSCQRWQNCILGDAQISSGGFEDVRQDTCQDTCQYTCLDGVQTRY